MDKARLEDTAAFLRDHRSSEEHFEIILSRLNEDTANAAFDETHRRRLQEIGDKLVATYRKAKETGGSAWPEFENFVADYEKAVTEALKDPS